MGRQRSIDFTDVAYYSEPNYSQLSQFKFNTRKLGVFAQAVRDAEAQILLADDLLKGGAGQIVPPADDGAFEFDLDGLEASGSTPELPELTRAELAALDAQRRGSSSSAASIISPSVRSHAGSAR